MLGALRDQFRPLARIIALPFLWLRLPPTAITVLSLVPAGLAAYLLAERQWFPALAVGALAGLFDMADGAVARIRGRVTAFGGYLDSVVDRIVDVTVLFGLGFALGSREGWALVGACVLGSYGTSYAKARAYEDVAAPPTAWNQLFERPERLLLLGLAVTTQGILAAMERDPEFRALAAFLAVFALGSMVSLVQRVFVVRRLHQKRGERS